MDAGQRDGYLQVEATEGERLPDASAMTVADALIAATSLARRGPGGGVNPQVGCIILGSRPAGATDDMLVTASAGDAPGSASLGRLPVLGVGWHRGAGTAHAEVAALADVHARGHDPAGAIAVVTLQPCNAFGRTGPCVAALIAAKVETVVFAVVDPAAEAAGSTQALRAAGVQVIHSPCDQATELTLPWLTAQRLGRPYVTIKFATSLDAKIAAPDGTSQWITSVQSRRDGHAVRGCVGAIVVGTQTLLDDDPALTARFPDGSLADHQPLRVVMGERDIPERAAVRGPGGELLHLRAHDPQVVVSALAARGVSHMLIEGGQRVTTAFLRSGLADEIRAYIAPMLLGGGRPSVGELGIETLGHAMRWTTVRAAKLGPDTAIVLRAGPGEPEPGQ